MSNCIHCEIETPNPKFCSRSCASSYNNSLKPKRKKTNSCKVCGTSIITNWTYCKTCSPRNKVSWDTITLGDIQKDAKYQVSAVIRLHARRVYAQSNKPKHCCNCGYSKHYEVCHIKAIKDFGIESLVAEINAAENLIGLCPNCHWELDHGHLKIQYPHLDSNQELLVRTER